MSKKNNKMVFQVIRAAVLGVSILALAELARGWPEPKIFSQPDLTQSLLKSAGMGVADQAPSESPISETVDVEKPTMVMDKSRPWQPPNYSNQQGAMGWSHDTFKVPSAMQDRVNFWKYVYTQITTDQGILHDSQLVSVVYDHIDFPAHSSPRERRRIVKQHKKVVKARLLKLDHLFAQYRKTNVMPKLDGEDLRLWNLFSVVEGAHKFRDATMRKRLRFQLGQRDRFIQGIYYSGRYLPEMERVFREDGLPIELTRLPFVESSFNVKARSRVGASGVWQFMRYTGRRFLRIRYLTDERNDPVRATEAAAKLFRINYEMLGSWPLAITGYNHGPSGMLKIIRRYHTRDISELVDERYGRFGFASANFYACFLAALDVEANATKYFGPVYWEAPFDAKEIKLTRSINRKWLLRWFDGNIEEAKDYNPHLQRAFWLGYGQIGRRDFIRVPTAQYATAIQDLKTLPIARESSLRKDIQTYVIEQGETLSGIAAELGVRVSVLRELNNIDNPRRLHPGQKLLIPVSKN